MAKDIDQQILNDLRQFDFVAQNIWPRLRGLFKRILGKLLGARLGEAATG